MSIQSTLPAKRRYLGTKVIDAIPMTRLAYNLLRGWTLPANENGDDAGYLVEYLDGGKANVEGFAGYVSWSPADVFEKAYKPAGTFQERVRLEKAELDDKRMALAAFFGTSIFAGLPGAEQQRLRDQLDHMRDYSAVLGERIDAFPTVETKTYADGTTVTGTPPLPDKSPSERDGEGSSLD